MNNYQAVQIFELLIPITLFVSIFLAFYFFLKFRNTERLALIESGADSGIFTRKPFSFPWMKVGTLIAGVGVGILVGSFLQGSFPMLQDTGIVFSMFFFGGLAMVVAAKLDKTKTEELN